jgi:hypothetical protein
MWNLLSYRYPSLTYIDECSEMKNETSLNPNLDEL